MKHAKLLSLGAIAALAACVPQPKPAAPVVVTPAPSPKPLVEAPVAYASWMDAPRTDGDWSYRAENGGSAFYGSARAGARFSMRCDVASRSIVLSRASATANDRMVIRTESQTRVLPAIFVLTPMPAVEARLPASDRLLDAMALSKGRFAVEVAGQQTLYLPSWAEVTRVIEDCR